jgi:DNA-binding beta-propeller fold protein YncE
MRARVHKGTFLALLGLMLALSVPVSAQARALLTKEALQTLIVKPKNPGEKEVVIPPPDGEIEAACGLAFSGQTLYVSDYYHGQVYAYSKPSQFPKEKFQYSSSTSVGTSPEGPCQLATGPAGALYANVWHQSALRLFPTPKTFDIASSTGLATDSVGNLYVNDRTHVNLYSSTGTLLQEVGVGHLTDAYGLAVSGKEVFVADAGTDEVKVFEPSVDPVNPKRTIEGTSPSKPFVSLRDAALAIDPTTGDLLVLDNLQPGFEHPHGAIEEFDQEGNFIGQLKDQVIDALPSGIAVDPETGILFVTSGNSEGSNVYAWSAETEGSSGSSVGGEADSPFGAKGSSASAPEQGSPTTSSLSRGPAASTSEAVQQGNLRVALNASLAPKKLPREKQAPVHFSVSANVSSADGSIPPQLRGITVKINRNGSIDPSATPVCEMEDVQPSTTEGALAACRDSFVGEGKLLAKVLLTQKSPFPSSGRIVAFNGTWKGRPAILAHVYGTKPVPTSFTMPFVISKISKGTFGTQLHATFPHFSGKWGYITGISLDLGATSHSHGQKRSYISAACRAPKGFGKVSFSLTEAKLSFAGHGPVTQTLQRSCGVR